MAKFAANSLKAKKVAILQDNGSDYSKGLTEFFTNTFKQLGGEILLTESYVSSDNDFSAQLTKIAAVKPDAIYVPGYYTQAGQIAQQARRAGITAPLMGGDGWDSPQLTEIGKEAINGCFFSNHYSVEDTAQNVQDFVSKYKQKYGQVPDALAALAYDAARIMFESIKKAGTTDGKILRETIAQTKEFKGVTGSITINKDRNADKPLTILEIKDGKYAFRENVSAN
jgi:branched-chain amino acid transport system substrate-binding protein